MAFCSAASTAKPSFSQRRRIWSAAARRSLPGTMLKKWPSPKTKSTSRASMLRGRLLLPNDVASLRNVSSVRSRIPRAENVPSTRREPAFYDLDDSSEGFEYLNDSTGSYTVDPGEKTPLIKRTCRAIESAFCPDDAKSSPAFCWTGQNTPTKSRSGTPYTHCCASVNYRGTQDLKKVLSNFFLALTDPWKTRASSIMDIGVRRAFKARHPG